MASDGDKLWRKITETDTHEYKTLGYQTQILKQLYRVF